MHAIECGADSLFLRLAQMAELVDALVSGTSILGCGGSSPLPGTSNFKTKYTLKTKYILKTKYTGFLANT